jgi:hypothetical protein
MVEMRHVEAYVVLISQPLQDMEQAKRIWATRDANDNSVTGIEESVDLNGVRYLLYNVGQELDHLVDAIAGSSS